MDKFKGIFLIIFAAIVFGFIPLFAKTAFDNGFNEYTFVLGRGVFSSVILLIYLIVKNIDLSLTKSEIMSILKISILGHGLMILTLVSSYKYMPTGIATAVHFIYPVIVMIGGVKYYGESINLEKVVLIITATVGIFFIIGLNFNMSINFFGLSLALISGVLYAYYILEIGKGEIKNFNPIKLIFYVLISNAVIFFAACVFLNKLSLNITKFGWYNIIIASLLLALAMISFKSGLEYISTITAAILSTFEPVTSLIVGLLILNEALKFHHIVGSILIIISALVASIVENKNINKKKFSTHSELNK